MGCKINWVGKRGIDVIGSENLKQVKHDVIFDRIEAGTYIIASALTKGKLKIKNIEPKFMSAEINLLNKMGVKITRVGSGTTGSGTTQVSDNAKTGTSYMLTLSYQTSFMLRQ